MNAKRVRFRLRTLLVVMLVLAPLLGWYGHELRKPPTPDAYLLENVTRDARESQSAATLIENLQRKQLAYSNEYRVANGERRLVFLYSPHRISFPGNNADTIVIADTRHRLVTWQEVGGESVFSSAKLTRGKSEAYTLALTRGHRINAIGRSVWMLSLANDQIDLFDIKWRDNSGRKSPPDDSWWWSREFIRKTELGEPTNDLTISMPVVTF